MYEVTEGIDYDTKILDLYRAGKGPGEIATEIGKAPNYVSVRLKKMRSWGWITEVPQKTMHAQLTTRVMTLFNEGLEPAAIMQMTGLTQTSVMNRLKRLEEKRMLNRPVARRSN